MQNPDLIAEITEKFKRGERRYEIKEALMSEGWKEEEIDDAIASIQQNAMRQLLGISRIYEWLDRMNEKHIFATPRGVMMVLSGSVILIILIAIALYFLFDPLNNLSGERDKQREADIAKIKQAVMSYYNDNNAYPASLSNLTPKYLPAIPRDPKTGNDYDYSTIDSGNNYQLCISFEVQPVDCIYGAPVQSLIPDVAAPTAVPTFAPQSASPAGGSPDSL